MNIMLHLGAHRCASTTFQSFLWANRVRLAKRGLTCWTPKRTRDGLMRGMMRHPALISVEDERRAIRSSGRLRVEFERLRRSGQNGLLISEENILGTMRNNIADTRLYPLLRERLMRFEPAFEGQTLRIGLCFRSYEDYWTSSLAAMIKRGAALPSVDLLDYLTTQPRRWRDIVRDIAAVFPEAEVVVWPFERLASQPQHQLEAIWGGDCRGLEDTGYWRNRSGDVVRLNDIMALRGEAPLLGGLHDAGARWMPFDEDQRCMLRAEYRRDLAWLAEGAEGLARAVTDANSETFNPDDLRSTQAPNHRGGPDAPAQAFDRADVIRGGMSNAPPVRGRYNGIEKGLDRTGAS